MVNLKTIDYFIESTINYINNNNFLFKKFNHFNNKYPIKELLLNVLKIYINGLSFRNISLYTNISWITIYKFYKKLVNYNIFENINDLFITKYLDEGNKDINKLYTDTTFINNQYGIENINYNPYNNKHKSTKVSLIIDEYNIPINITINNSKQNDSSILNEQLDIVYNKYPILFDNNKSLIADAAYDSSILRNKVNELKLGRLISPINKRNSKTVINRNSLIDKLKIKTRYKIEHMFSRFKKFKRLQLRYDKSIKSFKTSIFIISNIIIIDALKIKI